MTKITKEQTEAPQFISAAKVQNFSWAKVKECIRFAGQNYFPIRYTEIQSLRKRISLHHKVLNNGSGTLVLWN